MRFAVPQGFGPAGVVVGLHAMWPGEMSSHRRAGWSSSGRPTQLVGVPFDHRRRHGSNTRSGIPEKSRRASRRCRAATDRIDGPEPRDASSDPFEPTRSERSAAWVELRPHRARLRTSLRMWQPTMPGDGSRGRRYAPARGGPVHRRIHAFRRRARSQSRRPILRRRATDPPE